MSFSLSAQQAVYTALTTAGLTSITGGAVSIYDDVPDLPAGMPDSNFPYVVIGDDTGTPFDTDDCVGQQITLTLHVWSRYNGRKEVKQIMGQIFTVLNRSSLPVAGAVTVDCLHEFEQSMTYPGGKERQGLTRFRLTLQEI